MLEEIFDLGKINPLDFVDSPLSIIRGIKMKTEADAAIAEAGIDFRDWFDSKKQLRLFREQFTCIMAEEKVQQGFDSETGSDVLNFLFGMARLEEYYLFQNGETRTDLAAILNSADILARGYLRYKYIGSSTLEEYTNEARALLETPKGELAGNRRFL